MEYQKIFFYRIYYKIQQSCLQFLLFIMWEQIGFWCLVDYFTKVSWGNSLL